MGHSSEILNAMRHVANHSPCGATMWQATVSRAFTTSLMNQNTAADITRPKEAGAQVETHDVTTMDNLLRAVRKCLRSLGYNTIS